MKIYPVSNAYICLFQPGVKSRWQTCLQPWLLQFYAGILNLRVEKTLANYITNEYTDFTSIDWKKVAEKKEFEGYTETVGHSP